MMIGWWFGGFKVWWLILHPGAALTMSLPDGIPKLSPSPREGKPHSGRGEAVGGRVLLHLTKV